MQRCVHEGKSEAIASADSLYGSNGTSYEKQCVNGSNHADVFNTLPHLPVNQPKLHKGDARDLSFLDPSSVDLIVTSPPYWQRRDYHHPKQLGQEDSPDAYIKSLIEILDGWARLLRLHASVFLNLGDTYRDGFLTGIPAQFEVAARQAGWRIVNHIVWTKSIGSPQPTTYRLASRHEAIFHLTRNKEANRVFFDLFALATDLGRSANPGDVWDDHPDDVWHLHPARSQSDHPAPFPPDLVRRATLVACPERICTACGQPHTRRLEPTAELDSSRPQAIRAMSLFKEHGLTDEHLMAIRAVGISDAGKGKQIQNGSGRNAKKVQRLADEAKEALGGYFREFTFAPKRHIGWDRCGCEAPTVAGTVLDPFMGSGTTLLVAHELNRNAVGVDLVVPDHLKKVH